MLLRPVQNGQVTTAYVANIIPQIRIITISHLPLVPLLIGNGQVTIDCRQEETHQEMRETDACVEDVKLADDAIVVRSGHDFRYLFDETIVAYDGNRHPVLSVRLG